LLGMGRLHVKAILLDQNPIKRHNYGDKAVKGTQNPYTMFRLMLDGS